MPTRIRRPALEAVLAYRNPDVIDRFCDVWDVERAEAQLVFSDMLRFLWLVGRVDDKTIAPVPIVDEMWHTFLMFTKPYLDWSQKTFGYMLHHIPTTEREKRASARQSEAQHAKQVERVMAMVYDHLGEKVALRWYVLYADQYSKAFFAKKRRPVAMSTSWFPPELLERARQLNRGVRG
jgi:hypothetical protein